MTVRNGDNDNNGVHNDAINGYHDHNNDDEMMILMIMEKIKRKKI